MGAVPSEQRGGCGTMAENVVHSRPRFREAWDQLLGIAADGRQMYLVAFSNGNILAAEFAVRRPWDIAGARGARQRGLGQKVVHARRGLRS